jgi:uncharacterized protein (TIGR04540 family)
LNILSNPTTVKLLAAQLILACDAYISKRLSEKQLKELVIHYATYHGAKLFSANGMNPTVINRIGKKRLELVNIMLQGFQYKL